MSGRVLRGQDSAGNRDGLAFNEVLKAILCFPKITTSVRINQGHSFTVNPSQCAATTTSTSNA